MFRFPSAITLARFVSTGRSPTKSQWLLRTSEDSYLTHNALVQQATLPSTGLTTHNNYWNTVINNTYAFSPTWLSTFIFDASELHLTQTRNSTLGFALAFPFSSTTLTASGFETYGDNQFATPITVFPSLRNQEKYQFRYDVSSRYGRPLVQIRRSTSFTNRCSVALSQEIRRRFTRSLRIRSFT